jgi:hypothetical protein
MKLTDLSQDIKVERIPLVVAGGETFIEVTSTSAPDYIKAKAAFNRACSKAIIAGNDLFSTEIVLGEELSEPTELGLKLECILLSSAITAWGFDEPLNRELAAQMLLSNPKVKEIVDITSSTLAYKEDAKKKSA